MRISAVRTFTVPEGKRLIIEEVAYRNVAILDPTNGIRAEISTTFGEIPRSRSLNFTRQHFGTTYPLLVATHPFLAFADDGTEITIKRLSGRPN